MANDYKAKMAGMRRKVATAPNHVKQDAAAEIVTKIIERTPVLTGYTVAQWHASTGAPDFSVGEQPDPSRSGTINRAVAVTQQIKAGVKFFFTNGVPWIRKLERGSSTQAPAGMVLITLAETRYIFKRWFRVHLG